jgi:serine protease
MAIAPLTYADSTGSPFRVNNYAPGNQGPYQAATNSNGQTIVLFNDTSRNASFIQRYDEAGHPLQSDDFYVNTAQSVAIDDAGNFVTARVGPDGTGNSVFLTIFNSSGSILVPEFRVNNTIAGQKGNVYLAMSSAGEIAVTWTNIPSTHIPAVYVRRFHLNGVALGSELLASDPALVNQLSMGIGCDSQGNFVVTWLAYPTGSNDYNIYARRYSSSMSPLSSAFRVNTYTPNNQAGNTIAMNASGSFVIVWESLGQEGGNDFGIYGQRFNSSGIRVGGEFHVNSQTAGDQRVATVGMAADGSFTVAWYGPDSSSKLQVYAREFDFNGVPRAGDFLVSTSPNSVSSYFPHISMDPAGYALITWYQWDGIQADAYAQRYLPAGIAVQPLTDGVVVNDLAGTTGSWQYFKITVPAGKTSMDIVMTGPDTGDADLYIRYGALPTLSIWDARPFFVGNNEGVRIFNPPAGDYYIGINAASSYSSVSLQATTAQ